MATDKLGKTPVMHTTDIAKTYAGMDCKKAKCLQYDYRQRAKA